MKMVVISLSVLLLLLGIWIWFYYGSVNPVTSYYWENLGKLSDTIKKEDWETAKKDMYEYFDKWFEISKLWIYFINQKDIDNIDSSIRKLSVYIENEDKILAQAELEHLTVMFYVVDQNECLSIENIF